MQFDSHRNLAQSLLASVPADRTSGTDFTVAPGDGFLFAPNMPVTLAPYGKDPSYDNAEIARITSVSGDSLVLERGTEGSIRKIVQVGWVIAGTVTAGTLEAIEDAVLTKADQTYVDELVDRLDIRGDVRTVAGRTGNVVLSKADVGLNLADNTSDAAKPVSAAVQTALNAKYNASNPAGYVDAFQAGASAPVQSVAGRQGAVTLAKGDVGLGNVDNTSDASKPVSTATSSALATKVDKADGFGLSSNDYTGTEKAKLAGIAAGATANAADASLRDRTTHTGTQPVSTVVGLQTALDAKVDLTTAQTVAGLKTFTGANIHQSNNTFFGLNATNRVNLGNLGTSDRVYFGSSGTATDIRAIYNAAKGTGTHEFNAAILLPANPALPLQASTKQYADAGYSVTYTVAATGVPASHNAPQASIQTAINSALTLASALGGKVVVRKGSYTITGKIVLPSNVWLEAEPGVTLTKGNGVNDAVFQNANTAVGTGNSSIRVTGFNIVGNSANNLSNAWAFNLNYVSDSYFADNTITDCSAGFRCLGVVRTTIFGNKGLKAKDNSGFIGLQRGSSFNYICNNYSSEYTLSVNLDGLLGTCDYNQVVGNTFENDYLLGNPINGDCILVINGSSHNVVSNNVVRNFHEDGIRLSDNAYYNTVVGNTVSDIARWGITLATGNRYNTVSGNTVQNAGTGLLIDELCVGNQIVGNTVKDCTQDGITVNINGNNDNTLVGNYVENAVRYGIYVSSGGTVLTGNTVSGLASTDHGIYLLNASDCSISGNRIKNCTVSGIRLQATVAGGVQNNLVSGNRIFDDQVTKTQTSGIAEISGTFSPDYNTYVGNNVLGNLTNSMVLVGVNNEISNNMGY